VVICFVKNSVSYFQLKIRNEKPENFIFFEFLEFHRNRKFRVKHKEQDKQFDLDLLLQESH